jgi:cell division protein FtsZ
MMFTFDESFEASAKIKVVGVGGAGGNAINRMVSEGLENVEFIAVNTDAQDLNNNKASNRIQIGEKITQGLGAGADPNLGRAAMEEDRNLISEKVTGADMVFLTAGMGGGTGTGGAPVVAQICKDMGILTVAIVTRPFNFEGPVRIKRANSGIDALRKHVDTIIIIPNQRLLSVVDRSTSLLESFTKADDILYHATKGIADLITINGIVNIDFADAKTIMESMGDAIMGTGIASGENRAVSAANQAIHSPLLDDISIKGSKGILVNITGGEDISLYDVNDATEAIYNEVGPESETNIIFGAVIDPSMEGQVRVTVVATGFSVKGMNDAPAKEEEQVKIAQVLNEANQKSSKPEEKEQSSEPEKEEEIQQVLTLENGSPEETNEIETVTAEDEETVNAEEGPVTSIHIRPYASEPEKQKQNVAEQPISSTIVNSKMPLKKEKSYKIISHEMDNLDIPAFLRQEKEIK